MKSIAISKKEYSLLNKYIGQGRINASLVFFGNEPGTAALSIPDTLKFLEKIEKVPVDKGFLIETSYAKPTTSDFVRFISRLTLSLKHNDERFVGDLTKQGEVFINEHICIPNQEKDICLINLRPLPRPTQDTWVYSNINDKDYLRKWNFMLKGHYSDNDKEERLKILETFFLNRTGLVIGVGEKENKKKFFEKIYPSIEFHKAHLDHHSIYFNIPQKIILSDYFNNRNGIKVIGLLDLYRFITSRKIV